MSATSPTQRDLIATSAVTWAVPFRINAPEADFVDLRWRLSAIRWPDKGTVTWRVRTETRNRISGT